MKRLLFCMALLCSASAYSQDLKYDLNGDGKEDVNDVTFLTDYLLNKGKESESETEEHEYVDLGLPSGTLWATCNIGAESPEDAGLYFAWGESVGYSSSTSDGHIFSFEDNRHYASSKWTKYCRNESQGTVDNLTELEPADDAATICWGEDWCMPTFAQIKELVGNCTFQADKDRHGVTITSTANSNTMFVPYAGNRCQDQLYGENQWCNFWSKTLHINNDDSAYDFEYPPSYQIAWLNNRFLGFSIRPVRKQ